MFFRLLHPWRPLTAIQRLESFLDRFFGARGNPLRHLGALGFYFLWIALATGIYLFIVLDTGIEAIHASIEYYTREQWWLGGIIRSLHRYAADGLVLVMILHVLRELVHGRFRGFRSFTWLTGVPVIWLVYASGIGGYWLVWDQLGLFSALASAEWFDWLPFLHKATTRNFLPGVLNDRFFTLLLFLHIGIPLLLLLALWAHVQRIARADIFPSRSLAGGTLVMLLVLALIKPTVSHGKADLSRLAGVLQIDWYYLFIHPLMYLTSPAFLWVLSAALTLLLLALPLLPGRKQAPVAVVDPGNCNGCRRCFDDCPYSAITMQPHPDRPGHELASVDADLCASCGICAGACPSSTPFRSIDALITGIDMPSQPVGALRAEMERKIAALDDPVRIVVFGCDCAVATASLEDAGTAVLGLLCIGLLPPSFIEYALRGGADGVLVTGCREGSCAYRLGSRWMAERLGGQREPHLRRTVPPDRLRVVPADAHEMSQLKAQLDKFREDMTVLNKNGQHPHTPPPKRMTRHG